MLYLFEQVTYVFIHFQQERFVARIKHFSKMNTQSTGKISFDEWLNFTMDHIVGKVNTLPAY